MSLLVHFNYMLFLKINSEVGDYTWFDNLMIFCANLLIFCWPLVLLALWGRPLNWRKRALRPGEQTIVQECRAIVLWVGFACILAYGMNLLIEQFIFEPRPFVAHHVNLLVTHPADGSFPSDHTAWSFAVLGMVVFALFPLLIDAWRKRTQTAPSSGLRAFLMPLLLMFIALGVACLIGVARVFVGVHYPGDIIGGAIDGLIAALVVTLVRRWLARPTQVVLQFANKLHVA